MRLSSLFQNGMVLQRNQINILWGYGEANSSVDCCFAETKCSADTDSTGYFELSLPSVSAGGPFTLILRQQGSEEVICLNDILVGDVFLLGGQSNMELPLIRTMDLFAGELAALNHRDIRIFEVPKEYLFEKEREDITGGSWKCIAGEEGLFAGAVGYFLALALQKEYHIPIGLIQTAVGGTPIEAWCSKKSLDTLGIPFRKLECNQTKEAIARIQEADMQREQAWHKQAAEGFLHPTDHRGVVSIPGVWNGFCGALILERTFVLPDGIEDAECTLHLGAMIDQDTAFINGVFVGTTGYRYPPRNYKIPRGTLKKGENKLVIHLCVFREEGGFVEGKRYGISWEKGFVDLSGDYDYTVAEKLGRLEDPTFFQYQPAGLYQGMIYPIRKYNVCGILFYQGESNTGSPEGYGEALQAMIGDWRACRNNEKLPFIYIQLAGFAEGKRAWQGKNWALLREEQKKALSLPGTAMIAAYDAGEYNDLHPQDKKTVANRLALAVKALVYGEPIEYMGPVFERMEEKEGEVFLYFSHTGTGLIAGNDDLKEEPKGFTLLLPTGEEKPLSAKLSDNAVSIECSMMEEGAAIYYAWSDNPQDANLKSAEGLPAYPFFAQVKGAQRKK